MQWWEYILRIRFIYIFTECKTRFVAKTLTFRWKGHFASMKNLTYGYKSEFSEAIKKRKLGRNKKEVGIKKRGSFTSKWPERKFLQLWKLWNNILNYHQEDHENKLQNNLENNLQNIIKIPSKQTLETTLKLKTRLPLFCILCFVFL